MQKKERKEKKREKGEKGKGKGKKQRRESQHLEDVACALVRRDEECRRVVVERDVAVA